MKKKNIVGHMTLPKQSRLSWLRRSQLIPRLLCLLLAVLIWLIVSSIDPTIGTELPDGPVGEISTTQA